LMILPTVTRSKTHPPTASIASENVRKMESRPINGILANPTMVESLLPLAQWALSRLSQTLDDLDRVGHVDDESLFVWGQRFAGRKLVFQDLHVGV